MTSVFICGKINFKGNIFFCQTELKIFFDQFWYAFCYAFCNWITESYCVDITESIKVGYIFGTDTFSIDFPTMCWKQARYCFHELSPKTKCP